MIGEEQLLGTWNLLRLERRLMPSDEVVPDPPRHGRISFAPGLRVMSMLVWADRPRPAGEVPDDRERIALHKSLIAFSGRYTIEPDRLVLHIDMSWNEVWSGHDHIRFCTLDGDRMTLTTETHKSASDGRASVYVQFWEKLP